MRYFSLLFVVFIYSYSNAEIVKCDNKSIEDKMNGNKDRYKTILKYYIVNNEMDELYYTLFEKYALKYDGIDLAILQLGYKAIPFLLNSKKHSPDILLEHISYIIYYHGYNSHKIYGMISSWDKESVLYKNEYFRNIILSSDKIYNNRNPVNLDIFKTNKDTIYDVVLFHVSILFNRTSIDSIKNNDDIIRNIIATLDINENSARTEKELMRYLNCAIILSIISNYCNLEFRNIILDVNNKWINNLNTISMKSSDETYTLLIPLLNTINYIYSKNPTFNEMNYSIYGNNENLSRLMNSVLDLNSLMFLFSEINAFDLNRPQYDNIVSYRGYIRLLTNTWPSDRKTIQEYITMLDRIDELDNADIIKNLIEEGIFKINDINNILYKHIILFNINDIKYYNDVVDEVGILFNQYNQYIKSNRNKPSISSTEIEDKQLPVKQAPDFVDEDEKDGENEKH